ncbi:MAG TPA: hypothetical protein VGQ12_00485 [Candidatus Angelobacter sp.]|jgi:hypothetical protein|nr:hypothetical protein [Candidatus Angelobacter sp.]
MLLDFAVLGDSVYVPTVAKTEAGFYQTIEPVAVVKLCDGRGLMNVLKTMLLKGNPIIPTPKPAARATSVILKYSPIKSLSKFDKEAAYWQIYEKGGIYEFGPLKRRTDRGWEEDPKQMRKMPPGSTLDDVVNQVVESVQLSAD